MEALKRKAHRRQPTQYLLDPWPFRESFVQGRGTVLNVPIPLHAKLRGGRERRSARKIAQNRK